MRRLAALAKHPVILFPVLFLASLLCYETIYFQSASWKENPHMLLRPTPEWIPNRVYPVAVERALQKLSTTDPDKVLFLRARGIPIHVLSPGKMAEAGCSPTALGCTRLENATLNVHERAADSPAALAVVLSHELTHCRYHDAIQVQPPSSLLRRVFWRNEETEAHVEGLATARRLDISSVRGPLAGWWIEYLFWFWPAATVFLSSLVFFCAARLFWREATRRGSSRRAQTVLPTATEPPHRTAAA